jgi:hypothetical protein
MNCRRSEELLSDHLEGRLAPPLEGELRAHLEGCRACRDLLACLREGIELLNTLEAPEPPEDLTTRILDRTRPVLADLRAKREREAASVPSRLPLGYGWLAAAAVLALVLFWRPPDLLSVAGRRASLAAHQTYSLGLRLYHRGERWLDDLAVLRATVAVAFEDRLDLLNERLRLLQKARRDAGEEGSESSLVAPPYKGRV